MEIKEKKEDLIVTRGLVEDVQIREIDTTKRTATFVAATENGVMVWGVREVLRMSGIDLTRFNKNPIIVDTHDYSTIDSIVANAVVSVEGKNLIAKVTFAEGTKRADEAWQLVKTKFAKALSVGFQRLQTLELIEGQSDGEGDSRVEGPAIITTKWKLLEISLVPLPADEDALMRKLNERMENMGDVEKKEVTGAQLPAKTTETETKSVDNKDEITRKAQIVDITPVGYESISARCIAEGLSVDESRKLILAEVAKRTAPVGTPQPPAPVQQAENKPKLDDVSNEVLIRSIFG